MRVLLINPFYPISETPSPPLGLAYLASALSAAGIAVKILDLVVFPYSQAMLQNMLQKLNKLRMSFMPWMHLSCCAKMAFHQKCIPIP